MATRIRKKLSRASIFDLISQRFLPSHTSKHTIVFSEEAADRAMGRAMKRYKQLLAKESSDPNTLNVK
jgi:hypothetical protein